MPVRSVPFVSGEIYHVFNRGINKQTIFKTNKDFFRALETLKYYPYKDPPLRYSQFLNLPKDIKSDVMKKLLSKDKLIEVISYCLMPNHFHFLLRQIKANGVQDLVRKFEISYTRFFNTKYSGIGPILQGQFKAVRIEDENQLLHVSRYIHLNPYSSYLISKLEDIEDYRWSSLPEYLTKKAGHFCSRDLLLSHFKNEMKYKEFIFNQADYQRKLKLIDHLILE